MQMDEKERKELKAKEKAEVSTPAEQIRPGPIFNPAMDIFETDQEITVLADMPGVKAQDLAIDLRENTLTFSGTVESPEGEREEELLREYRTGNYYRQFTLSEVIDQSRIEAALKEGVLRLTLPKVEAAAPRTIPVKTG
jgi:HSP20 family protein